jgi:hypothetical protein
VWVDPVRLSMAWKRLHNVCPCVLRPFNTRAHHARHAPSATAFRVVPWTWRSLRNEKVSLTRTLITKLLTNPLAQARSTEDAGDHSSASGPLYHTGRLSMAWKRSGVRVP